MPRPIAPEGPQPGDPIIFGKFDGLRNTLNPERLGQADLVRARNVDLDDSGQLSQRGGFVLRAAGVAHSLFTTAQGASFGVLNGTLGAIRPNFSFYAIKTGVGSDPSQGLKPLSYAQVGTNLYYSGQTDSGVIDLTTFTWSPWGSGQPFWLSPVVSPDISPSTALPAVAGLLLGPPPNATGLAYFNGSIYLAVGSVLWRTKPFLYNFVDLTMGYVQFEGDITMVAAVADGLYIGTDEGLYFLDGGMPFPFKKRRVMDSAVVPGSLVMIPGELGNPPQVGLSPDTPVKVSVAFLTTAGFCVGQDGGDCTNLTETKYWFPSSASAAALFRRANGVNQYITSLQQSGEQNSAIGDSVYATVVRGTPGPRINQVTMWDGAAVGDSLTYTYVPYYAGPELSIGYIDPRETFSFATSPAVVIHSTSPVDAFAFTMPTDLASLATTEHADTFSFAIGGVAASMATTEHADTFALVAADHNSAAWATTEHADTFALVAADHNSAAWATTEHADTFAIVTSETSGPQYVQGAAAALPNGTLTTISLSAPVTSGNALCMIIGGYNLELTDDKSNSYSPITTVDEYGLFYVANVTDGRQHFYINQNAASPGYVVIDEISGLSSTVDKYSLSGYGASGNVLTTASLTTTVNGDFIWAANAWASGGGTYTPGTGYTGGTHGTGSTTTISEYLIQSTAGAIAPTMDISDNSVGLIGVLCVEPA